MDNRLGLQGKVAVVTGASRGLGSAIAYKLCASGCHVVLNYLRSEDRARVAVAACADLPGTALAVPGDMRDEHAVDALLDEVQRRYGRLDVFVHNAATWQPMAAAAPDPHAFEREQALALTPLLHGAGTIAKLMPESGGRIIAISSNGSGRVIPGYVGPGVAKAALESLVRYLAVELAGQGVAVNAIATAMLDKGPDRSPAAGASEVAAMLAARTPAGRLTTPADVADAVALLCTDEAAWIHGQVVTVDGGLGLRA